MEREIKSDENILSNNILIAKFMGAHKNKENRWYNVRPGESGYRMEFNFEYHKDWNWLMEVVEKINKRDWVTIYCDECKIHSLISGEFETIKTENDQQPLIKTAYESVVKYIQWYSKNNCNEKN